MKAYSLDLRERVANHDDTIKNTVELFKVSRDFVRRMRNQKKLGNLQAKVRCVFRPRKIDEQGEKWLEERLIKTPDMTLNELCYDYEVQFGVKVSKSSMDRTLKRLDISYKKKTKADPQRHSERVKELTEKYHENIKGIEPEQFIFIDEAGAGQNMCLDYGRAKKNERLHTLQPVAKGKRVSTIGALANTGLVTAFCFEGTLNAGVFLYFVIHFLIPKLKPRNVVVLDNASPHHDCEVVALIEATGAKVVYLPPYSPHLNPIEFIWSKTKHFIRKLQPRSLDELYQTWADALNTITTNDAQGCFNHVFRA